MSAGTLTRVTAKTAADICRRFTLDVEAKNLLDDRLTPKAYLDLLIEKGQLTDAIRVLAYGLPKPEAVWWACQCVRGLSGSPLPPPALAAVQAAEKWAADPSDDNRRACLKAGEAADFTTAAGCTALAAYWSGGTHAPPDAKLDPPAEDWTHHAAAGAVMMAALFPDPTKAPERFKKALDLGVQVGSGANKWK
ncbi:MAG TPA: hypothetical protein VGF55_08440 [Gemmataceae bacterium]|jgi:hypothetical protein